MSVKNALSSGKTFVLFLAVVLIAGLAFLAGGLGNQNGQISREERIDQCCQVFNNRNSCQEWDGGVFTCPDLNVQIPQPKEACCYSTSMVDDVEAPPLPDQIDL